MSAREKIAYLKGLIDGQNLAAGSTDKAKFYAALVDALESLAVDIESTKKSTRSSTIILTSLTKTSLSSKTISATSSAKDTTMMTSAASITITTKTKRMGITRNSTRKSTNP